MHIASAWTSLMQWVACSLPACVIVGRHIRSGTAQWLPREPSNIQRKTNTEMAIKWNYYYSTYYYYIYNSSLTRSHWVNGRPMTAQKWLQLITFFKSTVDNTVASCCKHQLQVSCNICIWHPLLQHNITHPWQASLNLWQTHQHSGKRTENQYG